MVSEKGLKQALERYAEAAKEYAKARMKRIKFEEALELDFYYQYLEERNRVDENGKKPSESEAKARAKVLLENRYKELAKLKAEEVMAEAVLDIRKRQLSVYQDIFRKMDAE
ncbi:MAG: hypothetical protein GXN93_03805 [Candidatus Diapherotrites archaeon]|nr:hypothetical protein [Candidatus Diapherotrites archaeon]